MVQITWDFRVQSQILTRDIQKVEPAVGGILRELFPCLRNMCFLTSLRLVKPGRSRCSPFTIKKSPGKFKQSIYPDKKIPNKGQQLKSEYLREPTDFEKLMQYPDLCNNRRTLTNVITLFLAGIKDSVMMPILTVWVPYFELISGFSDKTLDRILEDKVEIAYVPCWEICGERRLFYSSCLLLLGQATQWGEGLLEVSSWLAFDKLPAASTCLSFKLLLWDYDQKDSINQLLNQLQF